MKQENTKTQPVIFIAAMCAMLGGALHTNSALAADQVLIMTISDYRNAPLPGVRYDANNAMELAQKLGYDTSRVTVLRDQQITANGMRQALSDFSARVQNNDRVFIYYSGHGASYLNSRGQCSAALVSQDEKLVDTQEIKKHLDQIKGKVQDVLVIFDACYSGGHQDLALMAAGGSQRGGKSAMRAEGLSSKAWMPKEGERCDTPVNFTKSWPSPTLGARGISNPENNFTFIAAASEQQVALDDKEKGGLATTSLLQCATDGVATSALASPATLAKCAQAKINASVPSLNARYGSKWTAHDLQVDGNTQRPLVSVRTVAPSSVEPGLTVPSTNAGRVMQSFKQILAGANGNWVLSVQPTKQTVALGLPESERAVFFPYSTNQSGYGYLLYVGSDGIDMMQMFPAPGQLGSKLPTQGKFPGVRIDGPAGKNTFLFILSKTTRSFDDIFKNGSAEITPASLVKVQCETTKRNAVPISDSGSPCSRQRNGTVLTEAAESSAESAGFDGYAAQMVEIEGR